MSSLPTAAPMPAPDPRVKPRLIKHDSARAPDFLAEEMTASERIFDERIRTGSMVIVSIAVIYAAMYILKAVMIPFLIALALKYLLTPLIDCLSCRGSPGCFGCCKLPRGLAVLCAFFIAVMVLVALALVVVSSASSFAAHSGLYRERLESIVEQATDLASELPGAEPESRGKKKMNFDMVQEQAMEFLKSVSITDLIVTSLGTAAHIAENLMYVVLFLVFMLTHAPSEDEPVDSRSRAVDKQIFVYIRGKSSISAFVALTNGTILFFVGLDLWLAFGVLAFFLNFIPNVGMLSSVILPMPLVALDPTFAPWQVGVAFLGPLLVGTFAKDVLEPIVLGNSTSLHPIAVLLAIMIFGSVWGVTGMVMAVPLTAVVRLHLAAVDHPMCRALTHTLSGSHSSGHAQRTVNMM